jgi:hypothetical protein
MLVSTIDRCSVTLSRALLAVAVVFLLVRAATVVAYRDTLYYYGMVAGQYGMARAAYEGHAFAYDAELTATVLSEATRQRRHIPLEEWSRFRGSGRYTTYPAVDLPGYAYLIASTSRLFGVELTARYALAVQVLVELASVLLFSLCVSWVLGSRVALLTGLVYALAYPFLWPIVSQPMRDVFALGIYTTFIAASFVLFRSPARARWLLSTALLAVGSALLWVRPHPYYFAPLLALLVALDRRHALRERLAFSALVVLVPWLVFARPLRDFNLRHYGVPQTWSVGLALWQQLGIVPDNPYGFAKSDEALVPWVKARYGRDLRYGSPELNRLLGESALRVIREDPAYYLRSLGLTALEIAWTPLDLVPPFAIVEYSSSGLSLVEFARQHPCSFAYKLFNRALLASFFYGALLLGSRLLWRQAGRRLELLILLSPFLYTAATQLGVVFTSRYMTMGAWPLVLPVAAAVDEVLAHRARRRAAVAGAIVNAP